MSDFKKYTDYHTVLTCNALIWSEGKILLLKRAADKLVDPNLYGGVGGKVEPGESFFQSLMREVKEETGLEDFDTVRLYSVTQHPFPPTEAEWVNLYFIMTIPKIVPIPPNREGEFFWFTPEETKSLPMPSDTGKYIQILAKNPNAFIFGFFDHDNEGNTTREEIKVF